MRKLIFKFTLILTIIFNAGFSYAADNTLNTVLLEKTDSVYNIVLRTDFQAKINKKIKSDNTLDITLKNVTSSATVPILYRNVPSDSSIILSDNGRGEVKLHIQSNGISKSNVIFETPNSSPVVVNDSYNFSMILAGIGALIALCLANNITAKKSNQAINFDINIKDREMRLLRKYREELTTIPSINYNMKNCGYPRKKLDAKNIAETRYIQKV